ncbi:hypothetical protein HYW36_01680 [Candidatus Saccharibacteria bacterium]|nr:hypothetical protein [Candidatus Saccharibacteria bacterium]
MADTYWLKQTKEKPLFEDILWSRPENKRQAGKLLIAGGNQHGFAAPATAYGAAQKAGIGSARVSLPDKLQKTLSKLMPEAEFAPSTLSGSFSKKALAQLLDCAQWADGVLLAGDFGRNSETAILLDNFLDKHEGQVTVAQDGLDYFLGPNSPLIERADTLAVINLGKLQKLAKNNRSATPVLHSMMLAELVEILHDWTTGNPGGIITRQADNFIVASGGQISTTPALRESNWQIELAAYASVWWSQQPQKPFEAISTAIYCYVSS